VNEDLLIYKEQLIDIVSSAVALISDILPADWTEQNMVMPKPFPGPFRYSRTPYTKEIINCLSQTHPSRTIAIMKGAQIGFSAGVIYPGCGWIIKNNPGNTLLMVGAPDLIEKTMEKLDLMIDSCQLRNYIKPQVLRRRNNKSGDTNLKKEFAGGYISVGSANNHKAIRQVDVQYTFIDDYESIKPESKESGSTKKLLEQRSAAYATTRKNFYISTPERKENSNIEDAYLLGDQRKYLIPCPCCGEYIELKWTCDLKGRPNELAGITWNADPDGKLIPGTVGYICQECGEKFDDKNKHELLNLGFWKPTAEPSQPGYYSYHINSLYAPLGMFDWEHYVNDFLEANPPNGARIQHKHKAFVNLVLGETYEEMGESIKASQLQKNVMDYSINVIPETLSIKHGNGKIVLLTFACDLNGTIYNETKGTVDDARLDYELVAWAENGATYSITHGSIGTFIPNESGKKNKVEREKWSYRKNVPNSVWPVLDRILSAKYQTDNGRNMKIFISGIDTGYCEQEAFSYIDSSNHPLLFGLKGDKEHQKTLFGKDKPNIKPGQSRSKLYLIQVHQIKDNLSAQINLKWDSGNDETQPEGFMNFPHSSDGKYEYNNFYSHYESEQRLPDKDQNWIWQKKSPTAQNHLWDCRVYNMAMREILLFEIKKREKLKAFTWVEFCDRVLGRK